MSDKQDSIERAMELLRADVPEFTPRCAGEQVFRGEVRASARSGQTRRARRLFIPILALGTLAGVGVAARTGLGWLRTWWFAVEVDGEHVGGVVEGDGVRSISFEGADGALTRVRVERTDDEGSTLTRIDMQREQDGRLDLETELLRTEDPVGADTRVLLSSAVLGDVLPLYRGAEEDGTRFDVYVLTDKTLGDRDASGSLVLVHRPDTSPELVEQIVRLPHRLFLGDEVSVRSDPDGSITLKARSPGGGEIEFAWLAGSRLHASGGQSEVELRTPDGRVRVRVEGLPSSSER